jgi:hypothetical protein
MISQETFPIALDLKIPFPIPNGRENSQLGKSFVYQQCPLYIRGKVPKGTGLKVEDFVAGMWLGEFWVSPSDEQSQWRIDLDLFSGKGYLEFYKGTEEGADASFGVKWEFKVWSEEFSDDVKLIRLNE